MLRDNLVGLIEPMRISAGVDPLALSIQKQASDDRSSCLENPRPEGAESSLTETSPLHFRLSQHKRESRCHLEQGATACRGFLNRRTLQTSCWYFASGDSVIPWLTVV